MNKTVQTNFKTLWPLIQNAIESNSSFTFTAFGNSMKPYIIGGKDRVTLSPIKDKLKKGDVVFYRRQNGDFVLHRIIKTKSDTLYFCGDNQYVIEKIPTNNAFAILTSREKKGKTIQETAAGKRILITLLPFRRFFLHFRSFAVRKLREIFPT